MNGIVFAIEEFSVFDGPGIRTTVFLKGCPLHCSWCHNPEGQKGEPEIIRSPNGCILCGNCVKYGRMENGKTVFTEESVKNCPNNLLRWCGKKYSAEELCEKLLKNKEILNHGGGVTFSGGEPLFQSEFLLELLGRLKEKINTAVQTSGYCSQKIFKKVLVSADFFLYDLKIANNERHENFTGVSNYDIKTNYEILAASGKKFVTRIPLIPGVTDTEENITEIVDFMKRNKVFYAELLPYNKMAGGKYKAVGRRYRPAFNPDTEPQPHVDIFDHYGIKVKIL